MRMAIRYVVLGLLVYLFALLITFPAQRAYGLIAPALEEQGLVSGVQGIGGSLWSGRIAELRVNDVPVTALHWEISPWALLLGELAVRGQLQVENGYLDAETGIGLGGTLALRRLEGRLPVMLLAKQLPFLPVVLDGLVSVQLDGLTLENDRLTAGSGAILWHQAAITAPQALALGDLKLSLRVQPDGEVVGELSDGGGPLELTGDLSLTPTGAYRFQALLGVREGASPALAQSLTMLGKPDGKGKYRVDFSGSL